VVTRARWASRGLVRLVFLFSNFIYKGEQISGGVYTWIYADELSQSVEVFASRNYIGRL
jgi:hypothetical protein